jgi:hypothetical protein
MKCFPDKIIPVTHQGVSVGVALLVGALVFTGCSKAKKPSDETSAPTPEVAKQMAADHVPVYAPTKTTPTPVAVPNGEPDLAELNRAMLRWLMSHHRAPASFEDFAATAGVVIPPAPAGKKYIIAKDMHIQLVNK